MKYDVLIVGGGAAGLTAAAYTSRAGLHVALLDKQEKPGGLLQQVNRKGFIFDMGLRAIEDSGIILPMLSDLNLSMEYVKSPVSIGIGDRVISITSKESLRDYQELLEAIYPESRGEIEGIIRFIKRIMKDMDVIYGIENPVFKDLTRDYQYIFKRLLPWLFKFLSTIGRINRLTRPVEKFLATKTTNLSLRDMIGQHFFQKTPTFFAMSYFSVYLDYLYPLGGTATLMNLLSGYAQREGLALYPCREAVGVDPEKQALTDSTGETFYYKKLIWCADLKSLYRAVNVNAISDVRVKEKTVAWSSRLREHRGGDSVLSLFLSVDESPEYFRKICEGHFFYTPSPKGLGNILREGLKELLDNFGTYPDSNVRVKHFLKGYFDLNTFEISIPVLKDPSLAPPGKTGLILSCLFDYTLTRKIHEAGWYEELKKLCADYILDIFSESIFPGLRSKVLDWFCSTPLSLERITGNSDGAITGWAFGKENLPAVHKMQQVAKSVLTTLPNIFQAGQWTYSPSGLPIAVLTGKIAADRVIKELRPGKK